MTYGVTATGFVDKPIEDILSEVETAQKDVARFGPEFDTSAQSPAGQLNGVFALQVRELWEVAQAVLAAIDPDTNTGVSQAAVAALTGTVKLGATYSTVTATVNLDAGVTLPIASVASVSGSPDSRFETTEEVTNGGGAPADVSVVMRAQTAGAVVANTATLTEIETPATGWNTVTNALDAALGLEIETETALRIRREQELRRSGNAALDAIVADVKDVDGTSTVEGYENKTDAVDGDGLPPHSFEIVVQGGVDDAIAQAIWDSGAGGIKTHGSDSGTAIDEKGDSQTINFTRPTVVDIYIDVEVTVDGDYPAGGDTDIKEALAAWGQADLGTGDDVIWSQVFAQPFDVSGVIDVTLIETGIAPAPAGTANIPITSRQVANIDTADITVVST